MAGLGNHDDRIRGFGVADAFARGGVKRLRNEVRPSALRRGIPTIAGLDDPWRATANFDRVLVAVDPQASAMILYHRPTRHLSSNRGIRGWPQD